MVPDTNGTSFSRLLRIWANWAPAYFAQIEKQRPMEVPFVPDTFSRRPRAKSTFPLYRRRSQTMIRFSCSSCGKHLKAPDKWTGRKTSCPSCGQRLDIPPAPSSIVTGGLPEWVRDAQRQKSVETADEVPSVIPVEPEILDALPAAPTKRPASHPVASSVAGKRMSAVYTMKGVQDLLEVFEDRIAITPKGVLGFLNKGMKGTKEIPFASIVAVQFKEAGTVFSGFIQFTIPGGVESRGGVFAAAKDENTFMFAHTTNNAMAREIKEYIDSAVQRARVPQVAAPVANISDELQKLAKLRDQGVLSEAEFNTAKKRLLQ